jgi:hypothetical protein
MLIFAIFVDDVPGPVNAFQEKFRVLEAFGLVGFTESISVFDCFGSVETQMVWSGPYHGPYAIPPSLAGHVILMVFLFHTISLVPIMVPPRNSS